MISNDSISGAAASDEPAATSRHIRGSGLLLGGRFITLGVGFVAQVVIVRYLPKGDFGAFAYAMSVVSLTASVAAFGLDKATSRFLPIYEERGDRARALGLIILAVTTILIIGALLIGVVHIAQGVIGSVADTTTVGVLLLLVFLVPVQALDPFLTSILAALSHPRVIFVRRYIVESVLELAVLTTVILTAAGLGALALGYVVAAFLGLMIYLTVVVRILREAGYLSRQAFRRVIIPWREIFSFSIPLLSSDVVFILRGALVVILLELFGSAIDVADFRAVFPQARLNLVVLQSFTFLYLPLAARLHARSDLVGMRALHWRTSAWVTLMSFPAFAASLALAEPVVGLLYGDRYLTSAPILATLSVGFFVSAILGFAGLTLRALGTVRYIVTVDILTAVASFGAYLVLIPAFGALGAAVGTAATLIAQAVAYHVGAQRAEGVERGWGPLPRLIALAAVASVVLVAIQAVVRPPLWAGIALVILAWVCLLRAHRDVLDIGGMFPELRRVPVLGRLATGRLPFRSEQGDPP